MPVLASDFGEVIEVDADISWSGGIVCFVLSPSDFGLDVITVTEGSSVVASLELTTHVSNNESLIKVTKVGEDWRLHESEFHDGSSSLPVGPGGSSNGVFVLE